MNADTQTPAPFTRRIGLGVALAVALAGGVLVWWQFFSEPPSPWRVKWRISRYLKAQTHRADFRIEFPFPSKQEMARRTVDPKAEAPLRAGPATQKDFDTLSRDYIELEKAALELQRDVANLERVVQPMLAQAAALEKTPAETGSTAAVTNGPAPSNLSELRLRLSARQKDLAEGRQNLSVKEAAIQPVLSDLWAFQRSWAGRRDAAGDTNSLAQAWAEASREMRQNLGEAGSYSLIYQVVGQQLWVADRLFASANLGHRRMALNIARQACRTAMDNAENAWLAARICEGYIWPHLDAAEPSDRRALLSLENLSSECAVVFRRADETDNVVRNYERVLAVTAGSPRADWARVQLAQVHEQSGDLDRAVRQLKRVKATNDFAWALRRIPSLEQRARQPR